MATSSATEGAGGEMPSDFYDRPVLRKKIWERIHENDRNWMSIVCGDTGSGKSEYALRLCQLMDRDFNEDRIAFTVEEFLELVDADHPPGSFILFDEVGVALSHATHYDQDQIRLNHVLETWRAQNRGLVMTAPHMGLVQKASRGLLHAQIDMMDINRDYWLARGRYRSISTDTDSGDLYKQYPRLRHNGRRRKFRQLKLWKPTFELVEPYLDQKTTFNRELNRSALEAARADEDDDGRSLEELVDDVMAGDPESFVKTANNGREYVDDALIQYEYGCSAHQATRAKKVLHDKLAVGEGG